MGMDASVAAAQAIMAYSAYNTNATAHATATYRLPSHAVVPEVHKAAAEADDGGALAALLSLKTQPKPTPPKAFNSQVPPAALVPTAPVATCATTVAVKQESVLIASSQPQEQLSMKLQEQPQLQDAEQPPQETTNLPSLGGTSREAKKRRMRDEIMTSPGLKAELAAPSPAPKAPPTTPPNKLSGASTAPSEPTGVVPAEENPVAAPAAKKMKFSMSSMIS